MLFKIFCSVYTFGYVALYSGRSANKVSSTNTKPPRAPASDKPEFTYHLDVNQPEFLSSYEWRTTRMRVFLRDKNVCACCGSSPSNSSVFLCVDHILPRKHYPELALVLSNLQILCNLCNHGKGNSDTTCWR